MTWTPPSEAAADEDSGFSMPWRCSPAPRTTPPWLVTMVDLVSLLLTFMILLFACSRLDGQGWTEAASAIRTTFGGPAWMRPEPLPQPTIETPSAPPAIDLGYLALLIEARLTGARGAGWVHLAADRLRIMLPTNSSTGGWLAGGQVKTKQLRQLGAILANIGNAVVIEVGLPFDAAAEENAGARAWEAALRHGNSMAAVLMRLGVAPARIAVFVTTTAGGTSSLTASPMTTAPAPAAGIAIVVQRHGGNL